MPTAKLYNLARLTTPTSGTGTLALGSAVASFLSFAQAGVQDGDTVTYAIEDGSNREIGRGVYSQANGTLTRTVLKSSNGNNPINLSGSAQVFITAAAEDFNQLPESPLAVAHGGTGASAAGGAALDNISGFAATGYLRRTGAGSYAFTAGTQNYLPKWSGGALTGTSLITDDGANVGINNAAPSAKLDVSLNSGAIPDSASAVIRVTHANGVSFNGLRIDSFAGFGT